MALDLEKEEQENESLKGLSVSWGLCQCDAYRSVDVYDHLPSGLVAFAVVGTFLFLLQNAVSSGSVLQCEFTEDLTESVDADVSHTVGWMTEEQQERMEPRRKRRQHNFTTNAFKLDQYLNKVVVWRAAAPVDDPAVDNLEDDDPLSTVFEEVRHLLFQLGLHLMLGDHL